MLVRGLTSLSVAAGVLAAYAVGQASGAPPAPARVAIPVPAAGAVPAVPAHARSERRVDPDPSPEVHRVRLEPVPRGRVVLDPRGGTASSPS